MQHIYVYVYIFHRLSKSSEWQERSFVPCLMGSSGTLKNHPLGVTLNPPHSPQTICGHTNHANQTMGRANPTAETPSRDGQHNQRNIGSHATPSPGRRVLSIAVNPEDVNFKWAGLQSRSVVLRSIKLQSKLQCGETTTTQHSSTAPTAAAAAAAEHCRQSRGEPQAVKATLLLALYFKYKIGILLAERNIQIHARSLLLWFKSHGSKIFSYMYNSNKPGRKPAIPRVNTAPHGVETPTPLTPC